ncbi:hypothetical protein F5887DRAFT_1034322 [Amanita rubescens]|nr:hypothetical protein F5887DRAFT_1034322 [Amanita rubescens]
MTQIFSRNSLLRYKSRLGRVQMQSSSKSLHMIPEEEEPRTSCNLKRTFSTSHIEVSFADSKDDRSAGLAPRNAANERSGANSPAPSTSSASSYSPPTPTSSDDEFSSFNNLRPVSITPLNIAKDNARRSAYDETSFIELDSDDESDSEWYAQEFSKMIWPLPPSFSKQQPSRPESLQIEPLLTGATITRTPNRPKRVVSHRHKHSRSTSKKALPPPPAIPAQSLPSSSLDPSILQVVEPLESPNPVNYSRPRSLSLRRPPPRTSMPVDCLADDFIIGEDQSHWSSDFYPAAHELPSPALISPAPRRVSSCLTMPQTPDSSSMYSQPSALRHPYRGDFEDVREIELDDVEFDLGIEMSTRLSLSLSSSLNDLEADFTLGLDALWNPKEASTSQLVPPIIAVLDADEGLQSLSVASCKRRSSLSATSKLYHDSKTDAPFHSPEQLDTPTRPSLRSKWSNSTLASVYEQQRSRSKFSAADKFKHYFGVAPPMLKSKQQQEKQYKRTGSVGDNPSAIHHLSSLSSQQPSTALPASPRTKKAQRQAVLIPVSSSYLSLRKPDSSASPPLWKRHGAARSQS